MDVDNYALLIVQDESVLEKVKEYFGYDNAKSYDEHFAPMVEGVRGIMQRMKVIQDLTYQLVKDNPDGLILYIVATDQEWADLTGVRMNLRQVTAFRDTPIPEALFFVMGNAGIFGRRETFLLRHSASDRGHFASFWKDSKEVRQAKLYDRYQG